jgi:hypothetical protein
LLPDEFFTPRVAIALQPCYHRCTMQLFDDGLAFSLGLGAVPLAAQRRIVDYLARMKRLDPPAPGKAPLIRLVAARIVSARDRTARDLVIHSRVKARGATRCYDTRFRVFNGGRIERVA